jgi:hypothetical protein
MSPLALTLHPVGRDLWEARLGLHLICTSSTPIQAAAEILLAAGHHPQAQLAVTHAGSTAVVHRSFLRTASQPTDEDSAPPVLDRPNSHGGRVADSHWQGLR